jgi:flagellar biosynthesis/type III secretory pathway M-ring protein FliF/YscJ
LKKEEKMEKIEKKEIAKDTQKTKVGDIVRNVILIVVGLFIAFLLIMAAIRKFAG